MTKRDGVKENIIGGIKREKKDEGVGDIGDHHHHAKEVPTTQSPLQLSHGSTFNFGISIPKSSHLERSQNYFI